MTTDTFPRLRARKSQMGGKDVKMAGIDKGAGMIHPDMGPPSSNRPLHATLLVAVATDGSMSRTTFASARPDMCRRPLI